jgi:hypothetical protein
MIEELATLAQKTPAPQIRLVAHSMGSRLLLRASPLIKSKNVFSEVTFVCPDVDDGVVKHYVRRCLDKDSKAMVRLYMSHKDEMLKLSQLVHGGYARMGEDDRIVEALSPYKRDNQCIEGVLSAEALKHFQTIDFTTMDVGTLGHKIPVHLITSMSLSGAPPCDVEIEKKEKHHADCSQAMMDVATLNEFNGGDETVSYFKVKPAFKKAPVIGAVKGKLPVLHTFFGKDWTMK